MRVSDEKIDYQTYLDWQKIRTLKKWGKRFTYKALFERNFAQMWEAVKDMVGLPEVIGCMGIRSGAEYFEFKKYLPKSIVYGVDIADKVIGVGDNCYCYDFNYLPDGWVEKFDLLFSNSLDHSFKIEETLEEWRRVTKKGGFILIQFSRSPRKPTFVDRYSFDLEDIPALFPGDKYEVVKFPVLEEPETFYGLFKKK